MKQIMTIAFLFFITISLLAQKNDFAKNPKSVKQFTDQMVMVVAKTFIMGNAAPANISPADSLLVSGNLKRVVSTAAFYMSKNEVSNLEYRTFCEDMEKQQGKELASKFLPDTLVWLKEFPNGFFQPFIEHYFRHPAYNDYPVVGVSLEQVQAYCKWATLELNKNLKTRGKNPLPNFRLPTEAEWEAAALGKLPKNQDMQAGPRFAWGSSSLRNNKGLLLGNFRFLPDRNGYTEAGFEADNSTITAPVNAYLPNSYGIYNMSGNVSEWVQDRYSLDIVLALMLNPEEKILPDFSKIRTLYQLEGENATVEFLFTELMKINPKKLPSKEIDISIFKAETLLPFIYDYIRFEQEDSNQRNFHQLVKGGSWFDGPFALQIGARQILKQQCSSRVGFRMAMSIN